MIEETKYRKASEFLVPDEHQKNIIIPEGVEEIEFNFFNDYQNIETVTFPSTLKVIGPWAFSGCTNLREAIIPNGVEIIDVEAFNLCSKLRKVILPRTLKVIGDSAFSLCSSLEKITIPGSVKTVGIASFSSSSLREVVIEDGVKFIDKLAFMGCERLERISLPKTIEIIASNAFKDCSSIKEVTVPITVFFNLRLYEIEPFNNQNIKFNITYDNINEFNHYYLSNPEVIKKYQLKGNISFNSLKKQNPEPIEYDYYEPKEYDSPFLIKTIQRVDLNERDLSSTSLELSEGIEIIEKGTFKDLKNLKRITLPSTLKAIGVGAFEGCSSLEEVIIPEGTTLIGDWAFYRCKNLKRVTLPNSLETLNKNAFSDCLSLESITLPITSPVLKSLLEIKDYLSINSYLNVNYLNQDNYASSIMINAPTINVVYTEESEYSQFINNYIENIASSIYRFNFVDKEELKRLTKEQQIIEPEKKTILSRNDLGDNPSRLTSFDIPEGIIEIEPDTFKDCIRLKTVTFPSTLKTIYAGAFEGCVALENVTLNEGLEDIRNNAFENCFSLKEIILPSTIKSVGIEAFKHCESLKKVHLPSTLKTIGDYAFYGCGELENIELPEGLEMIGNLVFGGCKKLTNIKLSSTLKGLGPTSLFGTSIKKLSLPINIMLADFALSVISSLDEVRVEYTNFNELYNFVSRNKEALVNFFINKGPGKILFVGPKINVLDSFKLGLSLDSKAYKLVVEEKKEIPVEEIPVEEIIPSTTPEKEVIPSITGDLEIDTLINKISKLSVYLSLETKQELENQVNRIINKYNEAKKELEPKLEDPLKKYNLQFETPETVRLNTISDLEGILLTLNSIEKYNASLDKLDYYHKLAIGQVKAKDENDFIADDIRNILITLEKFPKEYKSKKQQELLTIIDDLGKKIRTNIDTLFDNNLLTNPEEIDYRSKLAISIAKLDEQIAKEHDCLKKYLTLLNTLRVRDIEPRTGEYPAEDLSSLRRTIILLPISQFRNELKKEYIAFAAECIQEVLNAIDSNECYTLTKYDEIIQKIRAKIIVLTNKINTREVKSPLQKMAKELEQIKPVSIHSKRDIINQLEICRGIILTRRAVEPLTMINTRPVEQKILEFYNKVITSPYLTDEYRDRLLVSLLVFLEIQKINTNSDNANVYNNFLIDDLLKRISELEVMLFDYESRTKQFNNGFKPS